MHTETHTKSHTGVDEEGVEQGRKVKKLKHPRPKVGTKPMRGSRLLPIRFGKPNPYGVLWTVEGKRRSMYFRTIELLEAKIGELNEARRMGDVATLPSREEVQAWRAFKAASGGTDPMEILVGWRAWREMSGRPLCTKTVAQAVDEFLLKQTKRQERGVIGDDTLRQKVRKLTRFKEAFASSQLDDVSAEEIEEWLDTLETEKEQDGAKITVKVINSSETFNDYVKRVSELYSEYSDICPKNPCEDIDSRKDTNPRPNLVMPVEDVRRLLTYTRAKRPKLLVRLAAELFVGLRTSSAGRLQREHFKLDHEKPGLDITANIIKTKDGAYIDSMPPVFWKWVKLGWEEPWDTMSRTDWMHAKSALFLDAEVALPHNGARHTFASYHAAAFENPGLTAMILCHRNQQQLWRTYKGKASKVDGEAYFAIAPRSC